MEYMESKNIKSIILTPPDGYEIDKENSTFERIVFKEIENRYPKSWDEAFADKDIEGTWISSYSTLRTNKLDGSNYENKNVFKTEKQAKSALAYAQITQLMALPCYNGDWEADWDDRRIEKYAIRRFGNKIKATDHSSYFEIAFKSAEARDAFLENNQELLYDYFQLDLPPYWDESLTYSKGDKVLYEGKILTVGNDGYYKPKKQ